ncbi:MAG: hypothetical protein K6E59_01995 [Bacilli bacterium]|nr:hypothetical protein [Bacilli bacterium]
MPTNADWALRVTEEGQLEQYLLTREEYASLRAQAKGYSVYRFKNIPLGTGFDSVDEHVPADTQIFVTKDGRLHGFYVFLQHLEGLLDLAGEYGTITDSHTFLSVGCPSVIMSLGREGKPVSPKLGKRSSFFRTYKHYPCSSLVYHPDGTCAFYRGTTGAEHRANLLQEASLYGFRVIERGRNEQGKFKRVYFVWFSTRDDRLVEQDAHFIGFALKGPILSLTSGETLHLDAMALLPYWPGLRIPIESAFGGGGIEVRMVKFDQAYSLPAEGEEALALEGHYELIG